MSAEDGRSGSRPTWPVLVAALTCVAVGLGMPILELLRFGHVSETVAGLTAWLTAQALIVLAGGKLLTSGTLFSRHGGSGGSMPDVSQRPPQQWPPRSGSSSTGSDGE